MKIYLAGPISGYSYNEIINYFERTASTFSENGFSVLHPMLAKQALRNELELKPEGYGNPESTNHAIFERDKWMVQNSDIVFCNLLGSTRVSIGSVMELAWASYLGKLTVVCMEQDNIHRHAFVLEAADAVFDNLDDAISYICALSKC